MKQVEILIGCAGWGLPRIAARRFRGEGSHLERYANVFGAVEINSSFYRPHRPATYARWASSVPATFRCAVKMPKAITHEARLLECGTLLDTFIGQVSSLGPTLGCLLIQLPPSLAFTKTVAEVFFTALRKRYTKGAALEPRHPSWFSVDAEHLLMDYQISRVAADPVKFPGAEEPGGWPDLIYFRLHGAPIVYRSPYDGSYLASLASKLERYAKAGKTTWCIFDNTALGYATLNALELCARIR